MTYEIHTWTLFGGWQNNSHENDKPLQFDTYKAADLEIKDMVNNLGFHSDHIKIIKL